ncbi:MAG: hypothetical protein LUE64_03775, partial [Candidatus Gastranaerophilales bacterium]|nr:hypothetical protein [Candidatus Gastranaerophilales bacterium]
TKVVREVKSSEGEAAQGEISSKAKAKVDNEKQAQDYIDNYNANKAAKNEPGIPAEEEAETLETLVDLSKKSEELNSIYEGQIDEATDQIKKAFPASENDEIVEITGRAKSQSSTFKKLAKKELSNDLKSTDTEACSDAIGDALGTRIQIKNLTEDQVADVFNQFDNVSYDDFVTYVNAKSTADLGLSDDVIAAIEENQTKILDALKTKQTAGVVEQLKQGISDGSITITEINNYGDDLTSYFTDAQIQEINDTYAAYVKKQALQAAEEGSEYTGKALKVVTRNTDGIESHVSGDGVDLRVEADDGTVIGTIKAVTNDDGVQTGTSLSITTDDGTTVIGEIDSTSEGAIKKSGYASTQMNTKHTLENGTTANGELQIRGTELNEFADAEHIPYDIRTGKISASDTKYSSVYNVIKDMKKETYNSYNSYIQEMYAYLRKSELGIAKGAEPVLELKGVSDSAIKLLSKEGLIAISKS